MAGGAFGPVDIDRAGGQGIWTTALGLCCIAVLAAASIAPGNHSTFQQGVQEGAAVMHVAPTDRIDSSVHERFEAKS